MKNFLTVLIISLSITNFYAQEIPHSIIKSEVFKDEYKHSSISLVEDDGKGGVIIIRSYAGGAFSSGIGYYFEHYDADLKLIKDYEYELKYSKATMVPLSTFLDMQRISCSSNSMIS